jgi:hypothetical protein
MKSLSTEPEKFESTYALIMRLEEKRRSQFETLIYTMLIISTMFALSQFGREALTLPADIARSSSISASAEPHHA